MTDMMNVLGIYFKNSEMIYLGRKIQKSKTISGGEVASEMVQKKVIITSSSITP